jgi:hypothetical protein
MYILRPTNKTFKKVCPECAKRGEVLDSCRSCRGSAIKKNPVMQYYVQDRPIEIVRIDRDPETGILRYWEDSSNCFNETTYRSMNKYVPYVPYGVHLCHENRKSADIECERINTYLKNAKKLTEAPLSLDAIFDF